MSTDSNVPEEAPVVDKQEARQAETKKGMPLVLAGGIVLAIALLGVIFAIFLR
jgi:hypothetical protein